MDWFLYDIGLRRERVKKEFYLEFSFNHDKNNLFKRNEAETW